MKLVIYLFKIFKIIFIKFKKIDKNFKSSNNKIHINVKRKIEISKKKLK